MVYPTKSNTDSRWLAFNVLAAAAQLLYNKLWATGVPATKVGTAVNAVFNPPRPGPGFAALTLRSVIPTPSVAAATGVVLAVGEAASTAGVLPPLAGAVPLLGAAASAGTGAAGASAGTAAGAASAAAGEGIFGTMYGAASSAAGTAAKFVWGNLSWTALGTIGTLGLTYLAYRYMNRSGVNITNTNTNTNTVNLNFVGLDDKTKIVKTEGTDGTVHVTVEKKQDKKLAEVVRVVLAEIKARKAAQAAAAA